MIFLKKYWWILVIAVLLIGAGLLLINKTPTKTYKSIVEINGSQLEEKINNKESFIVVISQDGCSHCEQFLPEFDELLTEHDVTAYDINITKMSKEENTIVAKYISFSGTPTTIFFNEGEEKTTLNRLVGYVAKTKVEERLKKMGFID